MARTKKDPYQVLIDEIMSGNVSVVRSMVRTLAESGHDLMAIVDNGILKAMDTIGERFEQNEIYVTELLVSARAVHAGLEEIKPYMEDDVELTAGRVVIGTVAGDLHDIGKNLLAMLLRARGYEVIDLGVDVSSGDFAAAVNKYRPDVLCLSALLTTTVPAMAETVEALSDSHLRSAVTIVVGGAALSESLATDMAADGYAQDALSGVKLIESLLRKNRGKEELDAFSLALHPEELLSLQHSFKGLTGLDFVVVDRRGQPLVDPGGFFDCCSYCGCWTATTATEAMERSLKDLASYDGEPRAFAYRCRCGLMEISVPLIGESGQIGSILLGHFLLEGDILCEDAPEGMPVISQERCEYICDYITTLGRKLVSLVDSTNVRNQLEGQQSTFVNFMKKQHQLEEALKEAELRALQYQVTPHFLFNALNTIAHVALLEGDKYTEKLVTALARLMRYSLYQVKSIVTLGEEVNVVQDYLMIQEARFRERISHRVDVEPTIMNAKMPSMILQPLVENACQHGLEPCKGAGIVTVQGWIENGQVFLEVSDNGVGMSDELKKNIFKLEEIKSKKGGQVSGLGLNNVLRRLQAHFGSDCAWDISSAINKGTTLQLSFPYVV